MRPRFCSACGRMVVRTERGLGPCCSWIRAVYRSERWRTTRRMVLERDGHRCSECGATGLLDVHHRVPLRAGGAPFEPANLVTLCVRHHRRAEYAGR